MQPSAPGEAMHLPDPSLRVRLRLSDDALEQMADAIGPEARHPDGTPKHAILLGDPKRDTKRVLDRTHAPGSETVGTVAARHAVVAGIDFWDSMRNLWNPVRIHPETGAESPFDAEVFSAFSKAAA